MHIHTFTTTYVYICTYVHTYMYGYVYKQPKVHVYVSGWHFPTFCVIWHFPKFCVIWQKTWHTCNFSTPPVNILASITRSTWNVLNSLFRLPICNHLDSSCTLAYDNIHASCPKIVRCVLLYHARRKCTQCQVLAPLDVRRAYDTYVSQG